jgi:hypothetical protein
VVLMSGCGREGGRVGAGGGGERHARMDASGLRRGCR